MVEYRKNKGELMQMIRTIAAQHGKYQINEYEVDISQRMRDYALSYAVKSELFDAVDVFKEILSDSDDKTPDGIVKTIRYSVQTLYLNQLADIAFLSLLKEKGIEYTRSDNQLDIVSKNGLVITTIPEFRSNHKKISVSIHQIKNPNKNIFIGVKLNGQDDPADVKLTLWDSIKTATIKGYADKDFLNNLPDSDFGQGIFKRWDFNRLMGIDALLNKLT